MTTPRPPARELSELEVLREDLALAEAALLAAWSGRQDKGGSEPYGPDPVIVPRQPSGSAAGLREENARLRRDLAAVLASPTWRAGSIATAFPRWFRDRKSAR